MVEVALYGEWEKWVPMSPQRVDNIEVTADNVHVGLRGASNEKVKTIQQWLHYEKISLLVYNYVYFYFQVTFYVAVNGKMNALQCTMNLAGAARLNVMENKCTSEA